MGREWDEKAAGELLLAECSSMGRGKEKRKDTHVFCGCTPSFEGLRCCNERAKKGWVLHVGGRRDEDDDAGSRKQEAEREAERVHIPQITDEVPDGGEAKSNSI